MKKETPMWSGSLAQSQNAIQWIVESNPKRPTGKAGQRFEEYFGAQSVKEYLDLGGTKGDLRYDYEQRFLDIIPVIQAPSFVPRNAVVGNRVENNPLADDEAPFAFDEPVALYVPETGTEATETQEIPPGAIETVFESTPPAETESESTKPARSRKR